jgi:anaerobic magnesium-protoporphyrin IX monomethyl ester cyclase
VPSPEICLINPPLISQRNDPHTGIIFMPFMLASLSAYLRQQGWEVQVLDAFGLAPARFAPYERKQIQGLSISETIEQIHPAARIIILHFGGVVAYRAIVELLRECRRRYPEKKYVLMENAQAVTSLSLRAKAGEFLDLGFDALLHGDPEVAVQDLLVAFSEGSPLPERAGLIFRRLNGSVYMSSKQEFWGNLDNLPFPDWASFPLENYWSIGYAHGPMEGPYLPLLTSRGCPVPCRFCVIPGTNEQRWRARSPSHVVDEMAHWQRTLGVSEFHIEDVNGTVRNDRIVEICNEIVRRELKVNWKFVAGTKIETMKLETIPILARAGCSYISFSPETGSMDLLKLMNKPFKHDLAYEMVRAMDLNGIFSQACFVLGFPGETDSHIRETRQYIKKLTQAGLDEIAQFIITPIPGSAIFDQFSGYTDYTELTFSPTWRIDYRRLVQRRYQDYLRFIAWKVLSHPRKVLRQAINVVRGRFNTKMEQALFRVTLHHLYKLRLRPGT